MYKYTCTYKDYNGVDRNESFYFDLSPAELTLMNLTEVGGMKQKLEKMLEAQDFPNIIKMFTQIVHKAYGEKSDDGRRFIKSEELVTAFEQTPAYSKLFMDLLNTPSFCREFTNGVLPVEYRPSEEEVNAEIAKYSIVDKNIVAISGKDNAEA